MQEVLQRSAKEGNISLILESYNDMFSDFDPRGYSERNLSEDFIDECKRAVRDKKEGVELRLLVPIKKRQVSEELKIKKRLKAYFHKNFKEKKKEIDHDRSVGLFWVFLGTLIMIAGTFIYRLEGDSFFLSLLFVVIEPAGWFTFWEGLHQVFLDYKVKMPVYNFYRKLSSIEVNFVGY